VPVRSTVTGRGAASRGRKLRGRVALDRAPRGRI
jgi:hypothetical protein